MGPKIANKWKNTQHVSGGDVLRSLWFAFFDTESRDIPPPYGWLRDVFVVYFALWWQRTGVENRAWEGAEIISGSVPTLDRDHTHRKMALEIFIGSPCGSYLHADKCDAFEFKMLKWNSTIGWLTVLGIVEAMQWFNTENNCMRVNVTRG